MNAGSGYQGLLGRIDLVLDFYPLVAQPLP